MSSHSNLLAAQIQAAIASAIERGDLQGTVPESIPLERPKNREHGDYASSVALQLAKAAGRAPRDVAELLKVELEKLPEVSEVNIAGPGFINITLNRASQADLVRVILSEQGNYGKGSALTGVKINLEFISANQTGPLHLGHTRWAAVGDSLGRVLSAAGAEVIKEFYINDRGNQMDLFGQSVQAAAMGQPIPEDGYQGGYISDLAKQVLAQNPQITSLSDSQRLIEFREAAYQLQLSD